MPNRGGFSWKRLTGVSAAKSRISRRTGIPLTRSGRQRKIGRDLTGGGCLLQISLAILLILLATTAACGRTSISSTPSISPTPIEITRIVEVTRIVQITVPVEITRRVEITRLVIATPTPAPTPTLAPGLQPDDVIAAFRTAGLEAADVHQLEPTEYKLAPYVGWGLRFLLPSINPDNYGGRIYYVEDPGERAQLKTFYEDMGKTSAILAEADLAIAHRQASPVENWRLG